MNYPESLQKLIESFRLLPGVGEKSAQRYAFSVLEMDKDAVNEFSTCIKSVKNNLNACKICGCLCEDDHCMICENSNRSNKQLCVVETQKNVFLFEKTGFFNGKYHVLGGLISPMDGINPEDIAIKTLITRIKNDLVEEIILALQPGIEGDTTALYITKILQGFDVKVTKIAHGIPIGADMEYIDALTLEMALENRSEVS
ncbi:MAG: recombination mediator RecR [Bacilli bacterium]